MAGDPPAEGGSAARDPADETMDSVKDLKRGGDDPGEQSSPKKRRNGEAVVSRSPEPGQAREDAGDHVEMDTETQAVVPNGKEAEHPVDADGGSDNRAKTSPQERAGRKPLGRTPMGGSRLFGQLLQGTLRQAKQDLTKKTEAEKRREELDKKLQEKLLKEKAELEATVKKEQTDKRERITRERQQEEQRRHAAAVALKVSYLSSHANYLVTSPSEGVSISYLPAKHNDTTRQMLEKRKEELLRKAAEVSMEASRAAAAASEPLTPVEENRRHEGSPDAVVKAGDAGLDMMRTEDARTVKREDNGDLDTGAAEQQPDSGAAEEQSRTVKEEEDVKEDDEMALDRDGDDDAIEY
ncbi:hypothetical protein DFJ74DRAFT_656894 [Hyaloraphidium curvatum]|nr:hypothetical protein DFJ74DRAFT_656894 [Hyaloraphidium curvatum]